MDTLKDIQNAYDAWIVDHPEAIGDLQKIAKWLAFYLAGAASGKVVMFQIIYNLMDDYNVRVIKRTRDAKKSSVHPLRSKL